jgi:hypothetical protein
VHLVLEIDIGSEPMTGRLSDGSFAVPFTGFLELLPLLERLRLGTSLRQLDETRLGEE